MTATVTDLTEFRARKLAASSTGGRPLADLSDTKLKTQYAVLELLQGNGKDYLTDMANPLVRMNFPNGYDPVNHPRENIDMIRAEAEYRGVELT